MSVWFRLGCVLLAVTTGPTRSAHAAGADWPPISRTRTALEALPDGATLVVFHPLGHNHVFLARRVAAAPRTLEEKLMNAEAYAQAIPSFEKADVVAKRPRGDALDQHVAWELEIPLWNLAGQLWFKPFANAVQIRMTAGAFSPGQLMWEWQPLPANQGSVLLLHGTANTKDANFGTRKIAARSPLAEPAMTVAAAYTLIEALADHTCLPHKQKCLPRWPKANMQPPARAPQPGPIAQVAKALQAPGPFGLIIRRPDGRLDHVQIALLTPHEPKAALAALAVPQLWRALPGWKKISAAPGASSAPVAAREAGTPRQVWDVDAAFPFLDFDATWEVVTTSEVRGYARKGAAEGAVWSWHAQPASGAFAGQTLLVFTLFPRLDRLGFVPRKFIEKEPLLEPGLALALAYVNAVSLARALPPPQ